MWVNKGKLSRYAFPKVIKTYIEQRKSEQSLSDSK